jgi:hypothetical protein
MDQTDLDDSRVRLAREEPIFMLRRFWVPWFKVSIYVQELNPAWMENKMKLQRMNGPTQSYRKRAMMIL